LNPKENPLPIELLIPIWEGYFTIFQWYATLKNCSNNAPCPSVAVGKVSTALIHKENCQGRASVCTYSVGVNNKKILGKKIDFS